MLAINWDDVIGVIQSISTHLIVGVIAIIVGIIAIVAVKGFFKAFGSWRGFGSNGIGNCCVSKFNLYRTNEHIVNISSRKAG